MPNKRSRSICTTWRPFRWRSRITAAILLAGQAAYRPQWLAVLLVVVVMVMAASLVSFFAAERIGKLLGVTGNVVLSRLLGVILAALAVQYVVDGVRTAFAI
jgi:multiple antibiotic resistance protein